MIRQRRNKKASRMNDPVYGIEKVSFPMRAISGPRNAAAIPPIKTLEAAFGIRSVVTLSIAANRNCMAQALVTPKKKILVQKPIKEPL